MKSTNQHYGPVAIVLHWVSAVLIVAMMPLGFLMQDVGGDAKLLLYRAHVAIGFLVLVLTVARLLWKLVDIRPAPPPGLTGIHLRGMEAVHVLLYVLLLALAASGIAINIQSGLVEVLSGGSQSGFPEFQGFRSRGVHGLLAKIYIGLLVAHVGGVLVHQKKHGHVLARMGIGRIKARVEDNAGE